MSTKKHLMIFRQLTTLGLVFTQVVAWSQPAIDLSQQTKDLIRQCRKAPDWLTPEFATVPVSISLDTSNFSDNFTWAPPQVKISRRFIYEALNSLHLIGARKPDLKLDQLDYTRINPDTMEIAILGVLCHEYGHFLRHVYNDTLMPANMDERIGNQVVEYTCDFVSGFTAGKSRWDQIKAPLYTSCAGNDPHYIVKLILAVYLDNTAMLNGPFSCLDSFAREYRHVDILIKYGTDCDHGLGESRKKAFDAGIFFAIFDGIGREVFEDEKVRKILQETIKPFGVSVDQLKETFANNLVKYLVTQKGMTNVVVPQLKTYSAPELYTTAFRYSKTLPRNITACGLQDVDHSF